MAGFLGNLFSFDPKNQEWSIFVSRLKQFIVLNSVSEEDQKRALLLTHLNDEAYKLLTNLVHPRAVEAVQYKELLEILNTHFTPRRSSFVDKEMFYSAVQDSEETVEDWAARLRGLAVHCEFGTALETILRDRFVLGLRFGPERDRLFEQEASKLTLARAVEVAQQAASARMARAAGTASSVIKDVKMEPLFRASSSTRAPSGAGRPAVKRDTTPVYCNVCGLKNHESEKCQFKFYKCQKCNKKGHLKKVCKFSDKNLNNLTVNNADTNGECSETWEDAVGVGTDKVTEQESLSQAPAEDVVLETATEEDEAHASITDLPAASPPPPEQPYSLRLRPRTRNKKVSSRT